MISNYGKFIQITLIGIGATITMDLWGIFMKFLGIKGLNMAHLGRWFLTLSQKKWFHENIANSPVVHGELVVGWIVHYMIGISFAYLLVKVYGIVWLEKPTLKPAIIIGIITLFGPLMILQPALGLGYFASKSANPMFSVLRSIGSHTIFGLGLYASAWGLTKINLS